MPAGGVTSEVIGPWLRRQREASGRTQEELAARSGMSVRALSDLERGRAHRPRPRRLGLALKPLGRPESAAEDLVAAVRSARAPKPGAAVGPPHRPAAPPHFVGRPAELAVLDELLEADDGPTVVISAIEG